MKQSQFIFGAGTYLCLACSVLYFFEERIFFADHRSLFKRKIEKSLHFYCNVTTYFSLLFIVKLGVELSNIWYAVVVPLKSNNSSHL